MSATLNRFNLPAPDPAATIRQGSRVLASIGSQEGLRALLAFSDLHENIRHRRLAANPSDDDLVQTERFVLHEVLQLICARAQALTRADNILIALAEGGELICRAAAGSLAIHLGSPLNRESEFLRECLASGKLLRCDDCETDPRLELDFARLLQCRSTVLVPLCGRSECLGVVQAFCPAPWAFTDQDVRSLDLVAELLLAGLKPSDQDRRLLWLCGVAGDVLQSKPDIAAAVVAETALAEPVVADVAVPAPLVPVPSETLPAEPDIDIYVAGAPLATVAAPEPTETTRPVAQPTDHSGAETVSIERAIAELTKFQHKNTEQTNPELAPAEQVNTEPPRAALQTKSARIEPVQNEATPSRSAMAETAEIAIGPPPAPLDDTSDLSQPVTIPVASDLFDSEGSALESLTDAAQEQPHAEVCLPGLDELFYTPPAVPRDSGLRRVPISGFPASEDETQELESSRANIPVFAAKATLAAVAHASRPGLSVVLALVLVAALFTTGVWWGMQNHPPDFHGSNQSGGITASHKALVAPPASDLLAPPVAGSTKAVASAARNSTTEDAPSASLPEAQLATLPKITGVRHWSSSMGSTVVIDMEDQVNYEVHRLMSPERIYFDLPDTALPHDLDGKTMDVNGPSLTRVRVAQPVAGITRVVLDTKDGSNFAVSMETNPYRLVVELRGTAKSLAGSHVPPSLPAAKPALTAPLNATSKSAPQLAARTGRLRIVLDAGHGGWDLGTIGRQGLLEKDLVLDVTQRLGKLLESRIGAEVLFTRAGDEYLPLDQRANIANQVQADLFVSVHANYSSSATARGVETYYTNLFSAPGMKELENHPEISELAPVTLSATGLQEKIEASRRLAASVQHALYGALAAKNPDIRDRGIKDASFVVLTGTTMPSILTEISFVSSPADEHNLQLEAYRQQIAEALFKGIAHYQETSPRIKVAQLRSAAERR